MLSVAELASRWGVSERVILKAVAEGTIVARRIGPTVKIARSHVEYLERNGTRRR